MNDLIKTYHEDKETWDMCAETYEKQIVGGHPDIVAFELFEEDFLDYLLKYLSTSQQRPIKLMDIGCGSGRLHQFFGAKTITKNELPPTSPYRNMNKQSRMAYNPILAEKLNEIWGIDFSQQMISLAERKLSESGFRGRSSVKFSFELGSAFDLKPESEDVLPVAVCLVNSIGVMQGPQGAAKIFESMRRAVEKAQGIAIISAYQQEYVGSYGLGQYESTLDVSGQPRWMVPDTFSSDTFLQVARNYKLAHSKDPTLTVDVFDSHGDIIKENHHLVRDSKAVQQVIESGKIRTYSNYKSHWYSFQQFDDWIQKYWINPSYHFETRQLDAKRAEPAQLAILDVGDHLRGFFGN